MSDSNSIQIEINVVDANGSVETIQATTAAIDQLGAAGTKASTDLGAIGAGPSKAAITGLGSDATTASREVANLGAAGETMSSQLSSGLQQVTGHTTASLQAVRLLRDDFGIHLPRSMEMAIAKNEALSSGITSLGSSLVGLGFAEIFIRGSIALYDAYQKYISLNAAAKEYEETTQKLRDSDFTNTQSIEDTTARINLATEAARRYKEVAESGSKGGQAEITSGIGNPFLMAKGAYDMYNARDTANQGNQMQEQADALQQKRISDQHQLNDLQIQANHASDASLQGQAKINAELQKTLQLHAEDTRYGKEKDSALGNRTADDAGSKQQQLEDQAAEANAAAQSIELQRQIRDKTISMQDEARNAGLQGNALYQAQEQEAIAAVERSATGSAAQVDAVRTKFHNMEIVRLQAETDEVNKRARAEQEASLTGLALIQAQGKDAQDAIQQKQDRGGYASAADADKDRQTAHDATIREMTETEKQFGEQVQQFSDQASSKMITGYAKVDAQRDAAVNKLEDDFAKVYGQMDTQDARYVEGQQQIAQGVIAINEQADRERVEMHAKTMADIASIEVQASKTNESENKAATGAIIDDYNRRLAQAQATLHAELAGNKLSADDQALVWQEYYARIQADADLAAAQMEKQAQQTRDKLADSLGDLFSDPAGFLEKRAKDMMYKVLANGIMSATNGLQSQFGQQLANLLGMGPDMAAPTGSGGGFGAIFGHASGTTGAGSPLQASATTLTSAGTTLQTTATNLGTVGTQLGTSGTVLNTAGTNLASAASALQSAASALSSSAQGGGGNSGSAGIGGGDDGGDDDGGDDDDSGMAGASTASTSASQLSSSVNALASIKTPEAAVSTAASQVSKLSGGGALAGAGVAGVAGGIGIYNAYENSSPLSGALAGGMAGAQIGGMFGPEGMLIGAGIGAVAGLLAGLFGDNGKAKAKAYDTATVGPALATELANFNSGQTGYSQASQDITNILNQAQQATQAMGSGARTYFTNTITPEVKAVQAKIDAEEKAGRSRITMSAAQFHTGGLISGFGDFATSGTEGFIHALMGERVMNPVASANHGPMLDAMNAGHTFTPLLSSSATKAAASMANGSTTRMGASGGGGALTLQMSAIDGPSTARWLRMGGGKLIQQHLNGASGTYGGKSDA